MSDTGEEMTLARTSFPMTGQPIRVVMIDGEPWFAAADVCAIIGRGNPTDAVKVLDKWQFQTIDLRDVTLVPNKGHHVPAGQKAYRRGNPLILVVSESGLYGLIMRSDKAPAKPFQRWVTDELLPSIRRGDTDVPKQQQRMAETLAEAIGQQVQIMAEIQHEDGGPGVHVRSDGTVHCRHGEMEYVVPSREEDSGPPFGPYYQCPSIERVGIRGGTALPRCRRLKLVDMVRHMTRPPAEESGPPPLGRVLEWEIRTNRIYGSAPDLADLLRELDQIPE
ncbi:Bro-N domain-containing protein [Kitasatospora sp. NPDC002227]|uniref:BRO-N domain-containing protein n=1 Tax=Kitasatospora sp. NPDC002227 TaxID=3154773 RepID=UPI003332F158